MKWRFIAPTTCIVLVLCGGIWFGLFSCGGYVSHEEYFRISLGTCLGSSVVFPPQPLTKFSVRSLFAAGAIATFILVRAGASAFYPGAPSGFAEFVDLFRVGVLYGPC